MEIPDNLLCVFSARVEEQRDSYVVEIPKREVTTGDVQPGAVHRTALLATGTETEAEGRSPVARTNTEAETESRSEPEARTETEAGPATGSRPGRKPSGPPVEEGEVREVEIEDIGDQGDGIARVERGYVIIVPESDEGDQVTIEITNVRENVAFGEIVESGGHFQ